MPSLQDQLKALGVQKGTAGIKPLPPPETSSLTLSLNAALGGRPCPTPMGETYVVEQFLPADHHHGRYPIQIPAARRILSAWAETPSLPELQPEHFVFLDTETTGLSTGTGTYAFLIGVGRFAEGQFHLAQFFMRDLVEEPAQLAALETFLAPCQAIVTFNGKAFDIPLLNTRLITHGLRSPFYDLLHVDLLHLARKLWRDRLPSRTLMNLEVQILGSERQSDDIPGWMIPAIYRQYLQTQDPTEMQGVLYHNALDVISMTALFNHMAAMLEDPLGEGSHHGLDQFALARIYEDLGDLDMATRLYLHGLEHADAQEQRINSDLLDAALNRLSAIYKRRGDLPAAMELWRSAAEHGQITACVELAIACEHRLKDYSQALQWTNSALDLLINAPLLPFERQRRSEELLHRHQRLTARLARAS